MRKLFVLGGIVHDFIFISYLFDYLKGSRGPPGDLGPDGEQGHEVLPERN